MLLNASEISSRLVSDLRLGLPVILYDGKQIVLAAAIETLHPEKLDKINHDAQVIHLFGEPTVDQPRKRKETGLGQAPKDPFYQKLPFKG